MSAIDRLRAAVAAPTYPVFGGPCVVLAHEDAEALCAEIQELQDALGDALRQPSAPRTAADDRIGVPDVVVLAVRDAIARETRVANDLRLDPPIRREAAQRVRDMAVWLSNVETR